MDDLAPIRTEARAIIEKLMRLEVEVSVAAASIVSEAGSDAALFLERFIKEADEFQQFPRALVLHDFIVAVRDLVFGSAHPAVAAALQSSARGHMEAGDLRGAELRLRRTLAICDAHHPSLEAAAVACLVDLGTVLRALADHASAELSLLRALSMVERRNQAGPFERLTVLDALSALARDRGRCDLAQAWTAKQLSIAEDRLGCFDPQTARALVERAAIEIELELETPDGSETLIDRAISILRPAQDAAHPDLWAALLERGRLRMHRGHHGPALKALRAAHKAATTTFGKQHHNARCTKRALANLTALFGPPVVARQLLSDLLDGERDRLGPDHPDVATLDVMLASTMMRLGEAAGARGLLEEALTIQRGRLDADHPALAVTFELMAELDLRNGDYAAAKTRFERACEIRTLRFDGRRHSSLARPLSGLARISSDLGHQSEALRLQSEAMAHLLARHGDDHPLVAEARSRRASILMRIGDRTGAKAEVLAACEARTRLIGSALGMTHADLASSLRDLGAIQIADHAYRSALDTFARAAHLVRQAFHDTHPDLVRCLLGQAVAHRLLGDRREANQLIAAALAILAAHPCPEEEWQAYGLLADLAEDTARPAAAIAFGKASVAVLQRMRLFTRQLDDTLQRGFLTERSTVYRALTRRLVQDGRLPEALEIRAMSKASDLREGLRGLDDGGISRTSVSLSLEEGWFADGVVALRSELATGIAAAERVGDGVPYLEEHQRDLASLATSRQALSRTLSELIATEPAHVSFAQPLRPAGLRTMRPDAAAIDFIVESDRVLIVVTTARVQISTDVTISERTLNKRVFVFCSRLRQPTGTAMKPARALHALLIAPIASHLAAAGIRTLTLSLDGALRYVPFAALHDGQRFLVEDFAISLRTSGIDDMTRDRSSGRDVAAFGMSRQTSDLMALPFVRHELSGIVMTPATPQGLLPGTISLDAAFTGAALQACLKARPSTIHIASHFVFRPAQDLESWLLLGDGGRLTVRDLLAGVTRLEGIDLIALSACDTAATSGGRDRGREVESLPSLLRARGVRTVLASLWPVQDATTAVMMRRFYRFWRLDGKNKDDALREAQLSILRTGHAPSATRGLKKAKPGSASRSPAHPYSWAAFALIGDSD